VTRPFLTAEWRYLVLLNFRVDGRLLAPHVPRGTVLDTWRGDAWVSLVGFRFLDTRLFGLPMPAHRQFPEVNLRFYVRAAADGRRAVVFLKEIVPRWAIRLLARAAYNEPYVVRPMRAEAPTAPHPAPGRVSYAWRHRGRWNRFGLAATAPPVPIVADSDEAFIAEHYWGYTRQRSGATIEYAVEHPTWSVYPSAGVFVDVDLAAEYGPVWAEALAAPPASAFLADGSAVAVGRPRLIGV
jgi:uncharacterized protein YqjF (DUF2071 family)